MPAPDTMPPVITLNGANPQTVYRGAVFSDFGATVTDDFDATRTITGTGTVDTSTVGSYTLTYSAQDEVGNVATPVTRTVNVVLNPTGDEDNDGLNNTEEANLGTNPYLRDTDSDGVNDLREVGDQTDPLDPASFDSLSQGLVAYYPFNGNAKDESGNGRNGAAFGVAFEEDGLKTGQSARFNGQQRIEADFTGCRPQRVTISVWVKPTTDARHGSIYVLHRPSYPNGFTQWHIGWNKDNPPNYNRLGSRFVFDQENNPFLKSEELQIGQWYHVVTTFDGTEYKMFLNGVLIDSLEANAYTLMYLSDTLYVGWLENGGSGFTGSIDEVKIYERGLSSDEVARLYADELYGGFGLEGAASKSPFDPATAANWSAGGAEWTVNTSTTHDGVDSVKAQTTDGQSTYREYTVTGPAVVDFWWKVSSEKNYDKFSYSLNGVNQETISGEVDWAYRTLTLPAGTHTIRWTYAKDGSDGIGQDAGWLDEFAVYPATATLRVRDGATLLDSRHTVDFGSTALQGSSPTKTLTFSNEGYVPMEVLISLPEGSPFTFAFDEVSNYASDEVANFYRLFLGRGESVDIPISLATDSAGTKTALLSIAASDSDVAPPIIALQGILLGQKIGLAQGGNALTSGQSINMGLAPRTLQFTINNTGNVGDLVISQISATGNFQITQQPQTTIAPQSSTTFTVLAQATAFGNQAGGITITSNDPDKPTFTIPLSATAFAVGGDGIRSDSMATSGSGGAVGWDFGTTQLADGSTGQAIKTGATPNNGGSALEMVAQTAGVVSWSWKVSAQEEFDWLLCEVDGQEVAGISTKNGVWQTQVVNVPSGANVRWVYRKDASGSAGEDAGYLAGVEFRSFAANQSFSQWAQIHGIYDPQQRMPKSGLQAMFGWLGGFRVDGDARPEIIVAQGRLTYRYPVSKTADGTQQILYSPDMTSWTQRRISQRVVSEDADRVVIEATAPSGTKGFFKVVGGGDTSGIMVRVQGGTLPENSELAGTTVSAFQIGKTEVTLDEWQEVRAWAVANGYSDLVGVGAGSSGDAPIRNVNWYDVVKWCNAKSEKDGLAPVYLIDGAVYRTGHSSPSVTSSANGHRLPTEAEWEWAARGGASSQGYTYSGSNDVNAVAWYIQNSGYSAKAVATKAANELGIHDMSGNVWEWCEDSDRSTGRRIRGGGADNEAGNCAVRARSDWNFPDHRSNQGGFRLARSAD